MTSAEHKIIAKKSLSGKWGFSVAVVLTIMAISFVLSLVPIIGGVVALIILPAITYIPFQIFLKVKRNEDTEIKEIFSSIFSSNLGTYWGIMLRTLQQLIPSIIIIAIGIILSLAGTVSAIADASTGILAFIGSVILIIGLVLVYINSLYYVQAIYIITDHPELTCKEAVLKSKELMDGHRFEYFYLQLTFIGWFLLGGITFGLIIFYLQPYMYTTFASYYDNLLANNTTAENNNENL